MYNKENPIKPVNPEMGETMKTHKIKLRKEFCDDVFEGRKRFEVRYNDRGYQTGDLVQFIATDGFYAEDPVTHECKERYTHPINDVIFQITYILNGWGLKNGFVAFGIERAQQAGNQCVIPD
ncbi:MAG: DUF3850 domain-containing protein [Ruminococcus sp.]|nr:DUF3850 domain-containing protein [Ruminococcus sp.]MBR1752891.1 DUF3850 domain-containing protein [Ruminococcus sp.]